VGFSFLYLTKAFHFVTTTLLVCTFLLYEANGRAEENPPRLWIFNWCRDFLLLYVFDL